jgi:drug/metabolite transporter (DMT)-like permease
MSLVGCYVGLSKLLVAALPLFLLAWLRFAIAAVAMLGWLRRAEGEPPLAPQNRKLLFFESFIGNFLFSICMLYGVRHTSAVAAGVVMAAMPAAVALLSRMMLREPITRRVALAIGCAAAGIAWLALLRMPAGASGSAATAPWWGYALLLAAVFCEAFYVVAGKRLTANVSPRRISALINLWGLALMTPFGLVQAIDFDFGSVAPPMWLLLVFYALAASMVTVWLWMRGLQQVPAPKAGVFAVLLPLSAALVGVLWLDEAFGAGHAGAFALALAGLLLAVWPPRPAR